MDYTSPPLSGIPQQLRESNNNGTDSSAANTAAAIAEAAAAVNSSAVNALASAFYDTNSIAGPIRHAPQHVPQHHPYEHVQMQPVHPTVLSHSDDQQGLYDSLAAAAVLAGGVPPPTSSMYYYDSSQQWHNQNWQNAVAAAQYAHFPQPATLGNQIHNPSVPPSHFPLSNGFQNFGKNRERFFPRLFCLALRLFQLTFKDSFMNKK